MKATLMTGGAPGVHPPHSHLTALNFLNFNQFILENLAKSSWRPSRRNPASAPEWLLSKKTTVLI